MSTSSAAEQPSSAPARPARTVLMRRLLVAVGLVLVLLVPSVLMVLVVTAVTGHQEPAATWASMPAIAGIAAVAAGGVELGIWTAITLTLLAPLSIVAGTTPITGAALMAIMCLVVGRLSRFGLHRAAMLVPIFIAWTTINPPYWGVSETVDRTSTTYLGWMAVIFFVGAIFPVIVLSFALRRVTRPAPQTHTRRETIPYTAMITVLTAVGTYYVLAHPKDFAGAFLVATILVLAPIGESDAFRPTVVRLGGTLLGALLVIVLVTQVSSLGLIYLVGLVLGVAAVVAKFSQRQWLYYVLMTPTAACLNAFTIKQVGELGEQRVVDNVVGGVLVLLAVALSMGYSRWQGRHENEPTSTRAATSAA